MKDDGADIFLGYLDALEHSDAPSASIRRIGPNPYQGLKYFDENASLLLTTREESSSQIRQRFTTEHCVFVIGGSGCGKSSLVRGKILDELRNFSRPIEGRDGDWAICSFRPETTPVEQFVEAFWNHVVAPAYQPVDVQHYDFDDPVDAAAYSRAERSRAEIRNEIGAGDDADAARELIAMDLSMSGTGTEKLHDGFATAYLWADKINEIATGGKRPAPANLMIIVDQFEELFRNRVDPIEAQELCSMIRHAHTATTRHEGVYVAISMRSEDVHRCAEVEGLADIVNSSVVLVDWLNTDDLKKAIVDPARTVLETWSIPAKRFGSGREATTPYAPEVVDQIVQEVTWLARSLEHKSDHLPLLQHGMRELWSIAARRWRAACDARELEHISVEAEDLAEARKRCGVGKDRFWLQAQLRKSARQCYAEGRRAYNAAFPGSDPPVAAAVAVRAVLCEMASRDENGKIHRDFAIVSDVVRERLLPDDDDPAIDEQRAQVSRALQDALKVFSKNQLLVELGAKSEPAYDVTHEALIRNWPQMRNWLDEDSELLDAYLNSVKEIDQGKENQNLIFEISQQYAPILEPTSTWPWLQRFRQSRVCLGISKAWAKIADRAWSGERRRYGDSFSHRWLVRAIAERQKGRENPNGHPSNSIEAAEIVRGVQQRWRRDYTRSVKLICFCCMVAISIIGVSWYSYFQYEENKALEGQRNSLISLMLTSNPAIENAPHYEKLREIKKGLKLHYYSDSSSEDAAKRISFVSEVGTIRNALERIGSIAQATTVELYRQPTGGSGPSDLDPNFNKDREALCVSVKEGGRIDLDEFTLSVGGSGQVGSKIEFFEPRSEVLVPPISASTRNEIKAGFVRLPSDAQEVCMSPDGRIAAVTFATRPVPQLYTLDVIRRFQRDANGQHPARGIAIMELQPSWYPEVDIEKDALIRVNGFGRSQTSRTRTVYFTDEVNTDAEPKFVAYFTDGIATPAPGEEPNGASDVSLSGMISWKNTNKDPQVACSATSDWEFGSAPKDPLSGYMVQREYVATEIPTQDIGPVKIVITSNVWIPDPKNDNYDPARKGTPSHNFVVFNIDLHHPFWGCKPLLLSNFVSSPVDNIRIASSSGKDGETVLYLLEAQQKNWRRITLLKGFAGLANLVDWYVRNYDGNKYNQEDSVYSRLSAVFGVTGSTSYD